MVMDERERRLAQNEALFREANERTRRAAGYSTEFICECADRDCAALVALSLEEYETVRRDPKQFVVLPGHQIPDIEEIVLIDDDFLTVQKSGEAGDYVAHLNPRSRNTGNTPAP